MALARYQKTAVDSAGNVASAASIEVRSEETNDLVDIYSDRAGALALENPFAAGTDGFYAFHAVGGAYKVKETLGSFTRTRRYEPIGLLGERDALVAGDIAFDPSGTGMSDDAITTQLAIAELAQNLLTRAPAHIFEWIPSSMHAALLARTSTEDMSPYFRKAFGDVGLTRRIYAPSATYPFMAGAPNITAGSDTFHPGLYLFGDGPGKTIFDNRAGVTNYTHNFATTNGSNIVTVSHPGHGRSAYGQITIHGSSAAVGGLNFDDTWMIWSVPNANEFTFRHTSPASSTASGSVIYGVTNPLLDIDTTADLKFQQFVHLSDFEIRNTTSPTASVGIRLRRAFQVEMERIWIKGMTKNGVHITCPNPDAGDRDGGNMISMRHMRIENCLGWGIDCELRSANVGNNEVSFLDMNHVMVTGCGTVSAIHPPPSGGIRWKGQILIAKNSGSVVNENCGMFIEGGAGLANTATFEGFTFENNKKKGCVITGLSRGRFTDVQFYNNDSNVATAGLELDGDNFVIRNITVNGAVVRATSGNNPYTAFYRHGTNADRYSCKIDRDTVVWDNFDYAGQARYSGFTVSSQMFKAHKNATDQTGILTETFTKVTFGTAPTNDDAAYDTANSRWDAVCWKDSVGCSGLYHGRYCGSGEGVSCYL